VRQDLRQKTFHFLSSTYYQWVDGYLTPTYKVAEYLNKSSMSLLEGVFTSELRFAACIYFAQYVRAKIYMLLSPGTLQDNPLRSTQRKPDVYLRVRGIRVWGPG
jgi:hypothetical protein